MFVPKDNQTVFIKEKNLKQKYNLAMSNSL